MKMLIIASLCLGLVFLLLAAIYLLIGQQIAKKVSFVKSTCDSAQTNNPSNFFSYYQNQKTDHDLSKWWFDDYQSVTIDSLDKHIKLDAWFKQGKKNSPWVIFVHGHGTCKNDHTVLVPAGMLVKTGFSVLLIDMREHGDSTKVDQRATGGQNEWRDVVAAWQWVRTTQKIPANKIGIYGVSLGSVSTAYAFNEEPQIEAIWLDTPFSDVNKIVRSTLIKAGIPAWFSYAARISGILFYHTDILKKTPYEALDHVGDRHVFITYGLDDLVTDKKHGKLMCEHAKKSVSTKGSVVCWATKGTIDLPSSNKTQNHVVAVLMKQDEWEHRLIGFFSSSLGKP